MTLQEFVDRWAPSQASEKANAQPFLTDLCAVLGVEAPHPSAAGGEDDYVFERRVPLPQEEKATVGFIDLYRRGAFVLEAKQGSTATSTRLGTAKRGTPQWTQAMQDARGQALGYARVLDEPVPFLVVTDVGYCFDLYACFDGSNAFRPFPTPAESRVFLSDLPRKAEVVERLRKVFQDPHALDPSKQSIKVTREVAGHLANLAKSLEERHQREVVARFLMRCLFTMFAEDVGLLPKKLFEKLLKEYWIPEPYSFVGGLEALWEEMDEGKPNPLVGKLLCFNGGLFRDRSVLRLNKDEMQILLLAALSDWSQVEPAIFGTLLERALDPKERHALGAHFTPRAYVERLVRPTVEEPLRDEWRVVRAEVRKLVEDHQEKKAAKRLEDFLHQLSTVRVLDPACGTGNFLYVTLDMMKAIESEARALHDSLGGGHQIPFGEGYSVTPKQLLGIEINPWAKEIAELVLWIGYLQWHFKTHGKVNPPEPVLRDYQNIECRDAVLEYDEKVPRKGPDGQPLWRWDGETMKKSPVTGAEVPDESARTQVFDYLKPRKARWPAADYIVSNPPFIGNKRMRLALGDGYVEALRKAHSDVPETVDFVMYWWNHAAELVRTGKAKRFGLITTNSITQVFSRKLVAAHLEAKKPLSLVFAIPDHPWVESRDGAAVRIAMTSGMAGSVSGVVANVTNERSLGRDDLIGVELSARPGKIHSDLTTGVDVGSVKPLRANSGLSGQGVLVLGDGFLLESTDAHRLLKDEPRAAQSIKRFRNGRDLMGRPRGLLIIDLYGQAASEQELQTRFPTIYQRLFETVRPFRLEMRDKARRERWWLFGRSNSEIRAAIGGLSRYIATCRTARHRVFTFVEADVLPDTKLVAIGCDTAEVLGLLSSRAHVMWSLRTGAFLGVGNDPSYNNATCFGAFPFPDLKNRIRISELGESLDSHRKARQAAHPDLTLTGMYNVLEKLRSGEALTDKDKVIHEKGLVSVLKKLHDDLDAAVLDAYGWPHDLTDEQIVERLVQLNAERAAEEKKGLVRWLRPEFQAPQSDAGKAARKPKQAEMLEEEEEAAEPATAGAPAWPKDLADRLLTVRSILTKGRTMTARDVAKSFAGAAKKERVASVEEVLDALRALGQVLAVEGTGDRRWTSTGRG